MYWSSRGLSITVTGPGGTTTVQLSKPFARVGSREGSEVLLTHPGISGRAAYIHATDKGIWCCSLARSGAEPAKLQRIRPGTGVHLGPYRLNVEFADGNDDADAPSESTLSTRSDDGLELQLHSTDNKSANRHILSRTFTIVGRGRPSNITLDDDRLSRVHCLLYRQGKQLWVIDLLSQNGTRLDGRRTEAMSVLPGERVAIGGYSLSYSVRGSQRHKEVRPPPPPQIIVEQTIVREQREQIVTRMIAHGSSLIVPPGGSAEQPNTSLESFFETIGDLARSASDSTRLVAPPQPVSLPPSSPAPLLASNEAEAIASETTSPSRLAPSEPAAVTSAAPPPPSESIDPLAVTTEFPQLRPASDETVAMTGPLASPPIITGDESAASTSSALAPLPGNDEPAAVVEAVSSPMPPDSRGALATAISEASPVIITGDERLETAIPEIPPLPAALDNSVTISGVLTTPTQLEGLEEMTLTSPPPLPSTIIANEPAAMESLETLPPGLAHEEPETFSDEVTTSSELYMNEPLESTSPPIFSVDESPTFTIPASLFEQVPDVEPETFLDDIATPTQVAPIEPTATTSFPPLLPILNDIEPPAIPNPAAPSPLAQHEPDVTWDDLTAPMELDSIEPAAISSQPPLASNNEELSATDSLSSAPTFAQDEPEAISDAATTSAEVDSSRPLAITSTSWPATIFTPDEPLAITGLETLAPLLADDQQPVITEASLESAPFYEMESLANTDSASEGASAADSYSPILNEATLDNQADVQNAPDSSSTDKPDEIVKRRTKKKTLAPVSKSLHGTPPGTSIDDSRSQVLDRLIDISTQQAGQARRRTLLIGAAVFAAIVLAAIGWYFFNQAVSGGATP